MFKKLTREIQEFNGMTPEDAIEQIKDYGDYLAETDDERVSDAIKRLDTLVQELEEKKSHRIVALDCHGTVCEFETNATDEQITFAIAYRDELIFENKINTLYNPKYKYDELTTWILCVQDFLRKRNYYFEEVICHDSRMNW